MFYVAGYTYINLLLNHLHSFNWIKIDLHLFVFEKEHICLSWQMKVFQKAEGKNILVPLPCTMLVFLGQFCSEMTQNQMLFALMMDHGMIML